MDPATEEPTKKLIIRTLDKAAKAKTSSKADDLIRDAVEVTACLWLSLWLALSGRLSRSPSHIGFQVKLCGLSERWRKDSTGREAIINRLFEVTSLQL